MTTTLPPRGLSHTYLSPEQVIAMLPGTTLGQLAMWRHRGKGPKYRKLGRTVVYALDEVNAWVERAARDGDRSL